MSETISSFGPADLHIEPGPLTSNIADPTLGNAYITTSKIATAYNMPAGDGTGVKVGIISFGGGWIQADLNKAMGNLGISPAPTINTVLIGSATNNFQANYYANAQPKWDTLTVASLENTLDIYCVAGLVPKANIVVYRVDPVYYTDFNTIINKVVSDQCNVVSISWAYSESSNFNGTIEPAMANAVANGVTILAATGDKGSADHVLGNVLGVVWPSVSPSVVAVGGTELELWPNNTIKTETVSVNSGGGISTVFPVPSWQNGLPYRKYFKSDSSYGPTVTLTSGTLSSGIGRGVPDISAPYRTYPIWFNGNVVPVAGTSASCPIVAGLVARVKSLSGKNFNSLNPILYGNSRIFNDFTIGNNDDILTEGYSASQGWDPVVGLGSPNGQTLLNTIAQTTKIKTVANTWSPTANVYVKTATNTWSNVQAIWTKVDSTTWKQTF